MTRTRTSAQATAERVATKGTDRNAGIFQFHEQFVAKALDFLGQ